MRDEKIEAMLPSGEWVLLAEWSAESAEYDAPGWIDRWGERVQGGLAPLPTSGFVDLGQFLAVRVGH